MKPQYIKTDCDPLMLLRALKLINNLLQILLKTFLKGAQQIILTLSLRIKNKSSSSPIKRLFLVEATSAACHSYRKQLLHKSKSKQYRTVVYVMASLNGLQVCLIHTI